jgi:hypothetical protein
MRLVSAQPPVQEVIVVDDAFRDDTCELLELLSATAG